MRAMRQAVQPPAVCMLALRQDAAAGPRVQGSRPSCQGHARTGSRQVQHLPLTPSLMRLVARAVAKTALQQASRVLWASSRVGLVTKLCTVKAAAGTMVEITGTAQEGTVLRTRSG